MSPLALSLRFLQSQPDHRLVALVRSGHELAFEALVRRYRAELLAYCRRLQPTTGSAEDVLQQTLLQAWRALNGGTEVRDLRPWLYRIARNTSLNSLRVVTAVPTEVSDVAGALEVDELVEQRMRIRAAFAELATLPTLQRQAFVSSMLDGASHHEVAASLSLSNGAVRGLIYRARSAVRAAAAAVIPSPVLGWAIRRAEPRTGGASNVAQALAGGSGTGVVAALAKGGAVITLAGAVAGAGGALPTPAHHPRHAAPARDVDLAPGNPAPGGHPGPVRASLLAPRGAVGAAGAAGARTARPTRLLITGSAQSATSGRSGSERRRGRPAAVPGPPGPGAGSIGGSDGGTGPHPGSGDPSGGSGGRGSGTPGQDASGGSDGRSSGSTPGPGSGSGSGTATVAGTDGGTSERGSDTKRSSQTTATRTSGDSSGSGSSGDSGSSASSGAGSSDSVTTSTATESR